MGSALDRPHNWIGRGELTTWIRCADWALTPLGDARTWSADLRSTLNLMLGSPSPMLLLWGPQQLVLHNDAASTCLLSLRPKASASPGALGRPAREVWPAAWLRLGPEVESVLATGIGRMSEGLLTSLLTTPPVGDTHWTCSLNPVLEGAEIGGVLLLLNEVAADRQIARSLEQVADNLHRVLEATTDGVVQIDRNWRFVYANRRAQEIVRDVQTLIGRNIWDSFPAMVYPGSPFVFHYGRAMDENLSGSFETHYPPPLNLYIHVMAHPAPDGIVVFFRDVTAQRQAEAALLQTEKLAAVGRMASAIAHEINNPLEAVTNLLYLAAHADDLPETRDFLTRADRELRRVSLIVTQTLRFHKQSSFPQLVTCTDLISGVLEIYTPRLENSKIALGKRKRANQPVHVYEGDIRQVLNNLFSNAIDAMSGGGRLLVRSRLATEWSTGRRGIVLTVADNGVGIPAATQPHIFEAFYSTKGITGTGLGLWVSAEIVHRHHGRLRIRSSQNAVHHGTVATLFLPFNKLPEPIPVA